ncbi:MAG: dipeptide epimerase [Bacteroidetes bacterium]|nr:MAG: dipeptide epimerase [Bacteroidota bacterium]REK00727.1 MAG: dipeptide epimerase [Bacteroidota bacterium]REK35151.1 MAG: dipeptide epimerase [Bacteroidota bacterium]REK48228.1 MAG: dipeptide epimerase [Bacteroidota bacterium]
MPRIREVLICNSRIPLIKPFVISLGPLNEAENIFVRITDENGRIGFGECSPFRTIHGETSETCIAVGKELAKILIRESAQNDGIAHLSHSMDKMIYGNTSIKSALDIALHDIAAQYAGLPLYSFLGGKSNQLLFTDYTISVAEPEEMSKAALEILRSGYPVIKVKLGGDADLDVSRIKKIRATVGPEIPIRIDANQAWTPVEAEAVLNEIKDLGIQHCEEPLRRNSLQELSELRASSDIPIMADESCFDHHDALNLVKMNACDSINIKLGKSSGLFKAALVRDIAETYNLKIQVGGFLESRLGFTAAAHFALSCREIPFIDFDTPLMQSHDPVKGGIIYHEMGRIEIPDDIGLGARIPDAELFRMNCTSISG